MYVTMRRAHILICEPDDRLTALLRERAAAGNWTLREVHHVRSCLRLLQIEHSAVFVLKVGRDLDREFGLLEQVTRLLPRTATVLVGDAENADLAALGWDLGARFILFPPLPRELLPDIVAGYVQALAADLAEGQR